jgi:lysophospholipase L1-like esterase
MRNVFNKPAITVFLIILCVAPLRPLSAKVIIKDGDTIAFLGDSITAGGANYGGYCRLVIQGLKAIGINAKPVFAGVPGETSSCMLLRLKRTVLDHNPDHLFIAAGVNDVWHRYPALKLGMCTPTAGRGVKLVHYKIYMREIITRARKADIKVILSTITPITEDPTFKTNKQTELYNAFLHEFAKEHRLPIAELNKAMFDAIATSKKPGDMGNVLTSDGVHPHHNGFRVMAKGILKAMGLTDTQLVRVEKAWDTSSYFLVLGDIQSTSGGRIGGWRTMLIDGLNTGPEIIGGIKLIYGTKMARLSAKLDEALKNSRITNVLLQSPAGDSLDATTPDRYEATTLSIIDRIQKKGLRLVISTIPIVGTDSSADVDAKADTYSAILRKIARDKGVNLADINTAMHTFMKDNPTTPVTFSNNRLTHEIAVVMAEQTLTAFGIDKVTISDFREEWDTMPSYTRRYTHTDEFSIPISQAGYKALADIRSHHHVPGGLIDHGLYALLTEGQKKNEARIAYFNSHWVSGTSDENQKPLVKKVRMRLSTKFCESMKTYMKIHDIDLAELYSRAFKIGVVILRTEDVKGRGKH